MKLAKLLSSLLLGLLTASGVAHAEENAASGQLVVCGGDEVFVLDVAAAEQGEPKKLWSWRAADCESLPEALRKRFGSTDECKPIDGGKSILIASSGGACALVERATGKALWHAAVPNAHSIEVLPNRRVVAAASVAAQGDRLVLFDLAKPDERLGETALPSAHGVVWDESSKSLWALGFDELRRYELADWDGPKPSLHLAKTFELPDEGGHDLQAVPQGADLLLSTHEHVYRFDRGAETFRPDPNLGDLPHVKCATVDPASGRLAVVQASDEAWWTDAIRLLSPDGAIKLPGEKLYKVRWLPAEPSR